MLWRGKYVSKAELGALIFAAWTMSLWGLTMTATSQRRGNRTLLERICWARGRAHARRRRAHLVRQVRDSSLATRPDRPTLDYLQREDVLYQVSRRALALKMIVPIATSVSAGGALATTIQRTSWHVWRDAVAMGAMVTPILITIVIASLVTNQGMQRWTTEAVTVTVRRAYEALLQPLEVTGKEPPTTSPSTPHTLPQPECWKTSPSHWRDMPCNVRFLTAATPCPRSWPGSPQRPPSYVSCGMGLNLTASMGRSVLCSKYSGS